MLSSFVNQKLDEEMAKRCQETSDFLERQQDEIDRIMQSVEDTQASIIIIRYNRGGGGITLSKKNTLQ